MTTFEMCLLGGGLFFTSLNLLMVLACAVGSWRSGRQASPMFVPFVGPVLLTWWILLRGYSSWFIPLVWLMDMGTMMILAVLPWLIRQWWQTSVFTRTMILHGTQGTQRAVITIHRGGHYLLRKFWDRPSGEPGIVGLGETGSIMADGDTLTLVSHLGLRRRLCRVRRDAFNVDEEDCPELRDYSLRDWQLGCREHHVSGVECDE